MSKISLLNQKGEELEKISISDEIWNVEKNDAVLHNHLVLSLASLRQGTAKTKGRSEISGGGRKPWRQKGTGRARQGSIRATQWRGGATVFGPTPRSYKKKMNKKERRLALLTALSYKNTDNELMAIDTLKCESGKTKDFLKTLEELKIADKKILIVVAELDEKIILASRNLTNILILLADELNTLDIVNSDIMLVEKEAIKQIEEVLK